MSNFNTRIREYLLKNTINLNDTDDREKFISEIENYHEELTSNNKDLSVAVRELEGLKEKSALFLKNAPMLYIEANEKMQVVNYNSMAKEYFPSIDMDLSLASVFPPGSQDDYYQFKKKLIGHGKAEINKLNCSNPDRFLYMKGEGIRINWLDKNNYIISLTDITKEVEANKHIEMINSFLQQVIDIMPSAVVVLDKNLDVFQWNRGMEFLTNISFVDACGKRIPELLKGQDKIINPITELIESPEDYSKTVQYEIGGIVKMFRYLYFKTENHHIILIDDISDLASQIRGEFNMEPYVKALNDNSYGDDGIPAELPDVPLDSSSKDSPKKVLIIDDIASNRAILKFLVSHLGFSVEEAVDGKDGLEHFKTFLPDVVFMDLMMPIMNGFDCTQAIRKWQKESNIAVADTKIIAVTDVVDSSIKKNAMTVGFDGYLEKPVKQNDIIKTFVKLNLFPKS